MEWPMLQLSPTAYEVAAAKAAVKTPAQRKREAQRYFDRRLRTYEQLRNKWTSGSQWTELQHLKQFAAENGLELPVATKYEILLHEAARKRAGIVD